MIKPSPTSGKSGTRTAAVLAAVIAALYLGREILIPLAFAITLALILTPAVAGLEKLRLGRFLSVLLAMVVTLAVAGGMGWIISTELVEVVNELPSYQENIHAKIDAVHTSRKGALGRAADSVAEIGKELTATPPPTAPTQLPGKRLAPIQPARPVVVEVVPKPLSEVDYLRDLATPILAPLGTLGIVLIFSVFLLIDQNDLRSRMFRLAGMSRLNVMTQALDDATRRVSRYLLMQLVVNAAFGALCGIGLYFIGVPYAALWGAVAGLLRIVPYLGSIVAVSLPLLLSLAVFDHWMPPLLVFALFATLEIVTGNFVEPWLYGIHTGISSLALLLTAVFWAMVWGPAGLILSTPLTVCVVVLGRHVPGLSFLYILLGDQPVLATEAQVYQRLLAMDDQEARAAANTYLAENSLAKLYDSVLIPVLTLAEQDRHKGALDPVREEFFFLSMKEIVGELSEGAVTPEPSAADLEPEPKQVLPRGRVLCLGANDEADEIAAAMLAQLMERAGAVALTLPAGPSLDIVAVLQPSPDDVFYISAVPPFAFARASTLCKLLEVRFPRTRIVIGVWGFSGDTEKALQRFRSKRRHKLVTNLAEAVQGFVGAVPAGKEDPVPEVLAQVS